MNITLFHDSDECESVPAGQALFREGDLGDAFYVVIAGEVDIRVGEELVETVGPGGVVGEMAMIDGGARSASAVARTDSRVVRLDEKRFSFCSANAEFRGAGHADHGGSVAEDGLSSREPRDGGFRPESLIPLPPRGTWAFFSRVTSVCPTFRPKW